MFLTRALSSVRARLAKVSRKQAVPEAEDDVTSIASDDASFAIVVPMPDRF